jgi:protein-tyrosine phosphatase
MAHPYRLLFVCMGNICRSPAAHGVMERKVAEAGLTSSIAVDSAGTGGWHAGDGADPRMQRQAAKRGYPLTHRARQVTPADFDEADMILIMDEQNRRDIRSFAPTAAHMRKVVLLTDFARDRKDSYVPDPYYGGVEGFEEVLDIVENACGHLLQHVRATRALA